MSIALQTEAPPMREDGTGAIRVGQSRVLLELVIEAFQDGASPESIVQSYPTATLSDVYGVIAYYLRHRDEVEAYLAGRDRQAEEVERRITRHQGDLREIRQRILAHKRSQG